MELASVGFVWKLYEKPMRGGSVEAWSQGCEVRYLAGAKGQESIGSLRRLNRAVSGYGLSGS
jgi:hypothetical protein